MLWNVEAGNQAPLGPGLQNLRGKRIVIVGEGAKVGRATAALLAGYGARVFFSARSAEDLGATLSAVAQARGEGEGMIADFRNPADVQKFFKRVERQLGQVDVLVDLLQLDQEAAGQELCIQSAARAMLAGGQGGQGQIISIGVHPSGRGGLAALRRELKGTGIRITRVEPRLGGFSEAAGMYPVSVEDVARCIYESLVQPVSVDIVFLKDQSRGELL
jgi:NADP-dependent 3-hydroxy acid dehydrogenase YdfG